MGVGIDSQAYEYVGQQRGDTKRDWKDALSHLLCVCLWVADTCCGPEIQYVCRYVSELEPPKKRLWFASSYQREKRLKLRRVALCACLETAIKPCFICQGLRVVVYC